MSEIKNEYEKLAIEACDLGKKLWLADLGKSQESELQAFNKFMFKLADDVRSGNLSKRNSALTFIIIQIIGFTSSSQLNRLDDLRSRLETTRKAIISISLPDATTKLLTRIVDLMEDSYLPDRSIKEPYFQIERQTVPDYLFEFYEAYLAYQQAISKSN